MGQRAKSCESSPLIGVRALHDQCLALASAFLCSSFGRPWSSSRNLAHPLQLGRGGGLEKSRKKGGSGPDKISCGPMRFLFPCFLVPLYACVPCVPCVLACRRGSREPRVERQEETRSKDQSQYRGKGRSGRVVLSLKGGVVLEGCLYRTTLGIPLNGVGEDVVSCL